uniref:Ig-like domain-containing protein n=1 Tax=Seriola dumerili TaxID=41447 RepID=A0A3B4U1G7_SERDU
FSVKLFCSCILPCSFQGGTDVVIHWVQLTVGHLVVHSFYHNQDQLGHQVQRFRDRTSLFKDQISRGNASLQLTGVEVQDQGRYKCHPSTIRGNKDSFINLKVDAPVDEVDLQQVENRTTCSSEGIYPQPELTWSTSPPSNLTFKKQTEVQKTEQLLYNISSSLIPSDTDTDVGYSCTVSTRRNRKRATLFKSDPLPGFRYSDCIYCIYRLNRTLCLISTQSHKKQRFCSNSSQLSSAEVKTD